MSNKASSSPPTNPTATPPPHSVPTQQRSAKSCADSTCASYPSSRSCTSSTRSTSPTWATPKPAAWKKNTQSRISNQYNIVLSVFFVPYVLTAPFLGILGKKDGPLTRPGDHDVLFSASSR
ncbi:hypothetical protein EPUS_05745 [Endocarpon pusillum Z07020]|uniref:Uncharacterized protein n=1 Tax=Endocarpon pusillum (strain Z07020 / HMAS-L-300199) TaxID=1263415 RepID=U1HII2_ENDPU|nr:uncharacterized protein EPUS_05745 [Endocarpon pusillum Z07020]ERF68684.1 hypothetical protein EPUS_05745 [Endocarpon pusillum Z07020]